MKHPIRNQLLLPLLSVLVVAVVSLAGVSAWVSYARQAALLEGRRNEVARVLEEAPFPFTRDVLAHIARLSGQQFVAWDPRQQRISLTSLESTPLELTEQIRRQSPTSAGDADAVSLELAGESYDVRVVRLKSQPGIQMLVLTPQRSIREARWSAIWPPLAVGAIGLVALVPWALALAGGWSRRVAGIQREVARIARGDKPAVLPQEGRDDELSALVDDIHQMGRQLEELQGRLVQAERERLAAQLAAGFAHQFRNGVAGASLALQLHAARCAAPADKSLVVAQRQLALLETEIRGMLSLGKLAGTAPDLVSSPRLIDEVLELVQPMLEHHAITLQRRVDGEWSVQGSRDGLRAALLNLLQNAIDAAGPGAAVRICSHAGDGCAIITVEDNGPGPSRDVADRMTEAFVTTKAEGIGLGLTVVSHVAADHGGRLSWRRSGEWTTFELSLPLHSSPSPLAGQGRGEGFSRQAIEG